MTQPRIFITHRHRYNDHYWTLRHKLRAEFNFQDLSVHDHKFEDDDLPLDFLLGKIDDQIKRCNVFIAIGRRYVGRAAWCKWEIDRAIQLNKWIATWSPHGLDPSEAPASVRGYALHLGPFTQARALATKLRALDFAV
ncbi:MAG: TIR domain-containing protein [Deltaproteobacteria bacterium]|nr:TIR domain-containing protein [Deltaproteobacteria bacterium]